MGGAIEARRIRALSVPILGFALLLVVAVTAIIVKAEQDSAANWVRHTFAVESLINRVQSLVADAESGQRGYLITGRESYRESYDGALRMMPGEWAALQAEIGSSPDSNHNDSQRRNFGALKRALDDKLAELSETVALRKNGEGGKALAVLSTDAGLQSMQKIRDSIETMRVEEERIHHDRAQRVRTTGQLAQRILIGAVFVILVLAYLLLRDARRRIDAVQHSNSLLAAEIEERAAAEGRIRQLMKIQAIGQLTGGIAHDFNNMLTVVIGSLDMARRRLKGDEAPAVARGIENAMSGATRAAALTARLLAFARQQPLEPAVVDANKLVSGMSELLHSTIGGNIQIETVLAGGLWKIFADPGQIENAIVNLGVNARDAMPDGGRLTIETSNTALDEDYVRAHAEVSAGQFVLVAVTDTGTGMAPDVVERALEPFFTTKGVGAGSGLGLSQVYGFVKQSAGHLKIYSEPGHGTSVKMYFPRFFGPEMADGPRTVVEAVQPGSAGETILVVEDEPDVRRVSVEALRQFGYTVFEAGSPGEALEHFASGGAVSLLFTDIVMPGMTGRQLADIAVRQQPGLRVLFTTGYTRNAIVHNGMIDPGTNFLAKPFTLDQLARKVREVLEQPLRD